MRFLLLIIFLSFLAPRSYGLVSLGGYVPFGPSTQKETTGSSNTFSFSPMISVNTIFPTPFFNQLFLPELAMVFHSEDQDGYSKRTTLFLFDFGHLLTSDIIFRYGVGTALTRITGEAGTVSLRNGNSTSTYYQPDEASTSWNTTINLGIEGQVIPNYSMRFQTYWFSVFNGDARKASYSLNLVYYL